MQLPTLDHKKAVDILIIVMTIAMVVTSVFIQYKAGYRSGYITGFETAVSMIQTTTQTPPKIISITGKVTDITGTTITVQSSVQAFVDPATQPATQQVATDAATVFERIIPKDQNTFQSEVNALNKKIKATGANDTQAPVTYSLPPFTLQTISLADLRSGDTVAITVTENTLTAQQLPATRVTVVSFLSAGSSATAAPSL